MGKIRQTLGKSLAGPAMMLAGGIGVLLQGCGSSECVDLRNTLPNAGFYSSQSVPQQITLDSLVVYGIGAPGDSLLYDGHEAISQAYLPLRIGEEETSYVLEYHQRNLASRNVCDTITFRYTMSPHFESEACGAVFFYNMEEIRTTHNVIDSVKCTSPDNVITNAVGENLRIYFRVASTGEGGGNE